MPPTATTRRLSPKVRRLLREHGLHARALAGTGAAGRVTPDDVLRAAGAPGTASTGRALASPRARRLLREAGLDIAAVALAHGGRRLTGADAARIVSGRSAVPAESGAVPRGGPTVRTVEAVVDAGRLVAALAASQGEVVMQDGAALEIEQVVASAAAAMLARRPEGAAATAGSAGGVGPSPAGVHVGFVVSTTGGPAVVVVPNAQYLTVAGLARRARTAVERALRGRSPAERPVEPTVVVAREGLASRDLVAAADIGLLTVDGPTTRQVATVDALGYAVVATRPHLTLRLHHEPTHVSEGAAASQLHELATAIETWSLPVGP
jgi:pyruvate/2-oxoglutarate dehydrogenase complex dihydrolipoamide acyltransferase (E2) component